MADSQLQADRVGVVHVQRLALQLKGELIEPKRESTSKRPEPFRPFSRQADVDILRCAGVFGKAEFHCHATLQVVVVQDAFLDRPLEHPAKSQKRNPAKQAFLCYSLFSGDSCKGLFQTFNGSGIHG